ncbi:MAG TPA: 1,4-alpha-glucan branching protein domain-containing protein [Candidatus Sulfotelmatobacter sp.]|nr:1,4-alpha-glucan branching protein domain-containing protein [Candidatus Sulfotelmatobacter sp.]
MAGYLALVLHGHLPFVRHPEHERFLEETWLFEAITETYVPLLQVLETWQRDGLRARLSLTLTPTLCAMLQDPLLQQRYLRHLNDLIELAEKEIHRTLWEKPFHKLALFYNERLNGIRAFYTACESDLVGAFRKAQERGQVEIITCAATHALLPLLAAHPPSLRAQILVARDHYRHCFGCDPRGIWLPECAYVEGVEQVLQEANLRWFIVDTHGILHAQPRPRYAMFAPIFTPNGVAAFGRDMDSAKQVWSRHEGYPGDPRYRDFYRDIGFDLDLDYVRPYLAAPEKRSFTGIKYHRITGNEASKAVYDRQAALQAADEHASHFLAARMAQMQRLEEILDRPPLVVSPYDAELFGHWWYEGPEFLDLFVRKAYYDQKVFTLITPEDYLRQHPTNQVAKPAASSWGEGGYWKVWLNEKNAWIYPHLQAAQERMTELARRFEQPDTLQERALRQAGRELLLAQASDWPFILRTETSPEYARQRVKDHLLRFNRLYEQILAAQVDEAWLRQIEEQDNIFPEVNYRYWATLDNSH